MVTLLRTLTLKSQLKYGFHSERRVSEMMISGSNKSYLVWSYYALDKISFSDDILTSLGITKKDRIEKPGTDVSKVRKMSGKHVDWKSLKELMKKNNKKRAEEKLDEMKQDGKFSTEGLRRRNQGH